MLDQMKAFTDGSEERDASSSTPSSRGEKILLMRNCFRMPPRRREILWQKRPRVRKELSDPNPEESQCVAHSESETSKLRSL